MYKLGLIGCLVVTLVGCDGSDNDGIADDNGFSAEVFADPPREYHPQTRWWWPGAAVEDGVLTKQLDSFLDVGYGAVEIQTFMATLTRDDLEQDPRIRAVGDGTYLERLNTAACAARKRGMPWDLTFGSGWSTGGVGLADDGARQLLAAELSLVGPATYTGPLPIPEPPGWIEGTNGILPAIDGMDQVLIPVAILAAEVLDDSTGAPVTIGEIVDLGDHVENETLSWVVPAGTHRVMAIYENRTQHYPAGAAYPGELEDARIIDHLDRRGVESFIEREFGRWIDAVSECPPRAVFVDSFELVGELPWTTSFGDKFAEAFGYEIEPYLPFLFLQGGESEYVNNISGSGPPRFRSEDETGRRAREDYEAFRSRLFAEELLEPLRNWLDEQGIELRLQAHGGYADVLDAYAMAEVPESEGLYGGGSYDFLRLSASAAHTAGKRFVSSESFIALLSLNLSELQIRILMGRAFSAGVNRLMHHGNAYPYAHQDGQRWYPFHPRQGSVFTAGPLPISSDFHPGAEIWSALPALNKEAARLSYALSRGTNISEVAWLYPHWEADNFPSFNIGPGAYESEISTALRRAGYSYDRVSRSALAGSTSDRAELRVGAASYRALLVDGLEVSDPAVLEGIERAIRANVPVIWMGEFPERADGLVDPVNRDAMVQSIVERLQTSVTIVDSAEEIATQLAALGLLPSLRPHSSDETRISIQHRQVDDGDIYFLFNESDQPRSERLRIEGDFREASLLDPSTGERTVAPLDGDVVRVDLAPGRGTVMWLTR